MNALDKIKKLLNQTTENGCTESEALTALTKARELMLKYKIEEKDIRHIDEKDIVTVILSKYNSNIKWLYKLIAIVAKNYGVLKYMSQIGKIEHIVLFGLKNDVECAVDIIDCAYNYANKEASKVASEYRKLYGITKGIKYTYFYGFVNGLQAKYDEQNKKEEFALMTTIDKDVQSQFDSIASTFTLPPKHKIINTKINDTEIYLKGFREGNTFGTTGISESIK